MLVETIRPVRCLLPTSVSYLNRVERGGLVSDHLGFATEREVVTEAKQLRNAVAQQSDEVMT